jgi:outer membrane lipoprotein-sorting protein
MDPMMRCRSESRPETNMVPKNIFSIRLCLFTVMACMLLMPVANAAGKSWTVKRLMWELSQISYARLNFVETRQSMFLSTDMVIEGNILYRAPDYIEKVTVSPMSEKIVVDGDTMLVEKLVYSRDNEAVVETKHYSIESHPVLKATVGSIRYILAGNSEMLGEYYEMSISGQCENWTLELTPRTVEISDYAQKIILSGNESSILRYVTIQADGDESVMTLTYDRLE